MRHLLLLACCACGCVPLTHTSPQNSLVIHRGLIYIPMAFIWCGIMLWLIYDCRKIDNEIPLLRLWLRTYSIHLSKFCCKKNLWIEIVSPQSFNAYLSRLLDFGIIFATRHDSFIHSWDDTFYEATELLNVELIWLSNHNWSKLAQDRTTMAFTTMPKQCKKWNSITRIRGAAWMPRIWFIHHLFTALSFGPNKWSRCGQTIWDFWTPLFGSYVRASHSFTSIQSSPQFFLSCITLWYHTTGRIQMVQNRTELCQVCLLHTFE